MTVTDEQTKLTEQQAEPASPRAYHVDCTNKEHHNREEFSRSQHTEVWESPALFYGQHISRIYPREKKRPWDVGTVGHTCLLEPEGMDAVAVEIPVDTFRTKAGNPPASPLATTDCKKWKEDHPGRIHLTPNDFEAVRQMIANVRAHPAAALFLEHAIHFEYTIIWEDEETGLPLRARPDMICEFGGGFAVSEFKTARSVQAREFSRDAHKHGYHRQQAMYSEAVEALFGPVIHFPFICSDKKPAYQCEVYTLSPRALELGREENRMIRRDFARRLEDNDWHSESWGKVSEVDFSEWAFRQ